MQLWHWGLEDDLKARGLTHLHVKTHGKALLVQSGAGGDQENHFRLTLLPAQRWRIDIGTGPEGWQRTPFEGTLKEAVALVAENFPWIVAARG